ncbi:hypothetical protein SERLA73DRAFT_106135 [Serpula lacrymans var. lacrymans S7.3]|uniref:Cytoplasmic protein n=2 Tax=Serpula lacrymans var. lacrymans TaxID=341189 RepID=F8PVU7_SERL3|nr:uncharacterized protein SERLADRAFT_360974 [Serpula lacrymans var. lacrymans S7.9]EGN99543.1 hypothetical protein SERLA73DRAFT_106135 [Serpula lacrymans var. lacrymans S7.3]EGO25112.1 hypothetical protein SERLADRAFT_360974 [Serpula lacrymans var. lacrymans S7.9]
MATSPAPGQRKGVWEPLPLIVYGYAVHALSQSRRDTRISNRTRLSTVTEASNDENGVHRDVVSLEVGDEVYAFEKYTPRGKEVEGIWYRGYVVCTTRRPPVTWAASLDPSCSNKTPVKTEEPQQVFIGIFPASHIYVRDELSDAEGRLPDLATALTPNTASTNGLVNTPSDMSPQLKQDRTTTVPDSAKGDMEDERKSFKLGPPPDQAKSSRAGLTVYPASIHSSSHDSQALKPLPPRPSLKSGDDTASGSSQPIIDEIASALREWHNLMFQYLARRDYKLFHTVREHIEALHLGRRQLLAQTLSSEETASLRRDCVAQLVSGNVVQGLDIIVRHPSWGALVSVDVEGELDIQSWMSAVRMYAMQTSLAYMNVPNEHLNSSRHNLGPSIDYSSAPIPTPAHSAFPELSRLRTNSRLMGSLAPPQPERQATAKFYHIFLDLRAFVASPCAPGETAELYFSLCKNSEYPRFVTEDRCVILNHNGVLARDPAARIRTLFTDISISDAQDPMFLVCRIVRNGAMKMGTSMGSGLPGDNGRRTSEASIREEVTLSPTTPVSARGFAADPPLFFRRPFGCAVLELTQLNKMMSEQVDVSPTKEYTMPIYVPTNEALFSMLHQDIIAKNTKEYEKSPRAEMLAVSIKIFHGDAATIVRENMSLLQDIPLTLRLGFPDVVFPGDVRNELYIKLWSGDFSSTHTGSSRLSMANLNFARPGPVNNNNVQMTIEIRDQDGRAIEKAISQGSGEPEVTQFHSIVFTRNNQPTFGELIKLQLPLQGVPNWHLFFTFRHRTGREKLYAKTTEVVDRPFAFAFQPLYPAQGAFLEDGSHTLVLYKADRLSHITPDLYLGLTPWLLPNQRPEQVYVPPDLQRVALPMRDTVTIRSSLCSTKFTQNPVLLSLLNWEQITNTELLSTVLTKFTFVGEGEIVKFLRDIFDSLFGILVSHNNQSGEIDHLVFNALVTVLRIVQDRRFSNFQPVLDVYIEKHFNCAAASSHMIHSMDRLLRNPTGNDTASPLRAALKVWHYIFKFITRSRELQKATELGMGIGPTAEYLESTFKREIRNHLNEVNRMMATSSPLSIIGTQTIALQHFTSILPDLSSVFSTVELVTIASNFAKAVSSGKGKIVIWKLIMYLQIVKSFLFDHPQSRALLVEAVVIWIKPHFGRFDEYTQTHLNDSDNARDSARVSWLESIRLCVTVTAVMLDKLQQQLVSPAITADRNLLRQEQDNVEYLLTLMPRLLDSYREFQDPANHRAVERTRSPTMSIATVPVTFPESYPFSLMALLPNAPRNATSASLLCENNSVFNPGLGETAIVFLVLVLSAPTKHIYNFLESSFEIEGRDNFASLLSQFFKVSASILENDAFPGSWLNVNILAHKVLIKMMDPVATLLKRDFIPSKLSFQKFNANLWKEAFYMLLRLLSSDQLVIEEFSPQKRRAVWRLGGDIRGEGADILLRLWIALGWPENSTPDSELALTFGEYQAPLSPLVGHVVNLCLSHHDQLRNNAVQILFGMIVSEYQQYNNFDQIENELVNKLDSLFMSDSKGDDISRAFFIAQLRHLFETSDVDEQLRERVALFLDSVDLFLKLLLSVRQLPDGDEYADDRVIATLRLMNFIRRIGRDEIYIKYVHQLVNMHLQSQNYVEAALTLKLHSDLHEWDLHTFVDPMEDLGLPQQSQFHRKETLCLLILDYLGKGKAYENAIEICKELAKQHAEVTFNYARLSEILRHQAALLEHIITDQRYYSDYFRVSFYGDFPDAIRNKQFIYRGYEWEKYGAFCERMLNKHPGAQLLKTMGDPPVDIRFGNTQYIQCTAVAPEPNRLSPIFTSPDVPLAVRNYYEHCAIDLFSCSNKVVKAGRDGDEEVWLEKAYFTTEEAFPTVLRRSEVVALEMLDISPVENALNEIEQKTRELAALNLRYSSLAKTTQTIPTNPLSMSLNSAVDAPVEGGISTYRETFFDPTYVTKYPERAELVEKLRIAIDDQVRIIDSCLKLHGQLCPPEMLPFHETLEKFFRKNFQEEIRRLAMDTGSEQVPVSPTSRSYLPSAPSQYQGSTQDQSSLQRSMSNASSTRSPFVIPPLQLGIQTLTSPLLTPQSPRNFLPLENPMRTKQTPLQQHLAHLTRHGLTGVSSGPRETSGSDGEAESLHDSLITVGNGASAVGLSGASVAASNVGSLGSIKGRLSRFGSLNFSRRGGS